MIRMRWIPGVLLGTISTGAILHGTAYATSPATLERIQRLNEKLDRQAKVLQQQQDHLYSQINAIKDELDSIRAERTEINKLTGSKISNRTHSESRKRAAPVNITPEKTRTANAKTPNIENQISSDQTAKNQKEQAAENQKKQTSLILQTNSSLSQAGGVLTPKGTLIIDPSIQYAYYNTNQINVDGFTIVPGITFGNLNVNKFSENLLTERLTFRYGLTNRSDIYVRIPFDNGYSTTITSPVLVGQSVAPIAVSAHAFHLGDIEFGGSYQLNEGSDDIPTFVANLNFKTITGTSPFDVPIFTSGSPEGIYLQGIDKQLPTGSGFYQLQPSLTILYPTSPVILFANLKYVYNFSRTVNIQNIGGGPSTSERLQPGNGVGISFGMGFSLNDRTSFSIGYEEDQYFNEKQNGRDIKGTAYDSGAFNFGLGYQITHNINANIGVSIGVGPNSPAAQIDVRIPISMNIF